MAEGSIYLTMAREKRQPENDGYISIISQGQPQLGDRETLVLAIGVFETYEAGKVWYDQMMIERPWETRN